MPQAWPGFREQIFKRLVSEKRRVALIAAMIAVITLLHYNTRVSLHHYHILFRELYFVPIILAGFLYGVRGALTTSLSITALYIPFVLMTWENFSPDDFDTLIEIVLYNVMALSLGILSDRERMRQKHLRDSESLAAMGRAMSGVAHDMKGPLVVIGGYSQLVQKDFQKEHPSYQKLDVVCRQVQRLENLTRDMLDFARPLELRLSEEDINTVVSGALSTVELEARKKGVRFRLELSGNMPPARIDSMRMERVLINLLMNAVQASPEGETVTVETLRHGRNLVIDIIDCGCGIESGEREKIFEPFYTTKKEGTGLGLAIAGKIVEAHGGSIKIVDNHARGATFRIVLPAGVY